MDTLTIDSPQAALWHREDGSLNVQHLWRSSSEGTRDDGEVTDAAVNEADAESPSDPGSGNGADPDSRPDPLGGWTLSLAQLALDNGRFDYTNATLDDPAEIAVTANLQASGITTRSGERAQIVGDLNFESGGQLTVEGEAVLLPQAELAFALALADVNLAAFQPYLNEVARARLQSGTLSWQGRVVSTPDAMLGVSGAVQARDLSIVDDSGELIGWKLVDVDEFAFAIEPPRLELSTVRIDAPFANILIDRGQNLNVSQLIRTGDPDDVAPDESDAEGEPMTFVVGAIQAAEGTLKFSDESLPLPFATTVSDFTGNVSTIDSASSQPAEIEITGQVDQYGEAGIQGALQPLDPINQLDLAASFRNITLPDLTPYTIRYAGQEFDGGRMDLALDYRLSGGMLEAQNNIVITDLRLGDKVPHPDALDLPLGLAISLLKRPDGTIDLDIPVSGDVNDPEFRISGVIMKALSGVITNLVTSPFRLLGSLVGEQSDEFGQVAFAAGESEVTPEGREKLARLAQALEQRPELGLQLHGVYLEHLDIPALRAQTVDARIQAALAEAGDTDELLATRRRAVIERLFRDAFPDRSLAEVEDVYRQAGDSGDATLDETAYVAALRSALIDSHAVPADALDALAAARAAAVASALTESGVDASRIETVAIKQLTADDDRVHLDLEVSRLGRRAPAG